MKPANMKPAKLNTPLIAIGGALLGASAASYQVTGEFMSSPEATLPHAGYIVTVAAVFGVICGVAAAMFNRSAR
ncbi:MAG TPA: hypothetical protein VE396_09550 [Xanthobacteraceae bacterium]|jgi:uncharacterized protein involved in exopolysaccharide biosynthesis|nr:hypothetical protein [Xanthobacteraceae bacterium]